MGSLDNTTGVTALLELSDAHMHLPKPTKRSVLFIAGTAEEAGLLGAKYYAENPLYTLAKTLSDINIAGTRVGGKTHAIEDISAGNSNSDYLLAPLVPKQRRVMVPTNRPQPGRL